MATGTTATTFQRYKTTRPGNYCTLPTIDVPILTAAETCRTCALPVHYDPAAGSYGGAWVHPDGSHLHYSPSGSVESTVSPRLRCRYCGCDDEAVVTYHQHAWYDATECARCGGVDGHAIGD